MSVNFDAASRLLTVADRELGAARTGMNEFVQIATTVTDQAERAASGGLKLRETLGSAQRATAAIESARAGVSAVGDNPAAIAAIDDARAGADEVTNIINALIPGGQKVSPSGVAQTIEEARGRVAVARDSVRSIEGAGDKIAEEGDFAKIATATKGTPRIPEGVTNEHIDEVAGKAAAISSEVGKMPTVEKVAVDMVAAARAGKYDSLVGREEEIDQVLTVLQRRGKPNPILLGDPGVGKTQLIEGLALRISKGEVPESMRDLKIYSIDAATLKAEAGGEQGGMEKLVKGIVDEVSAERAKGNQVALFIDELHTLMGAGDTAQQLKPALARGDISLIGATTWEEYDKFIAKDGALVRRVAPISIEELPKEKVLDVLRTVQPALTKHHDMIVLDSALQEAQKLSGRYVKDRKQPDPAIELLDHAMSRSATSWKGAAPADFLEMSNEVGRLKSTVRALDRQLVIGDTSAAGKIVSANARLAELEPKVTKMSAQLEEERTVLTSRNTAVRQYLAHLDAGDTAAADAMKPQIEQLNADVAALREKYPERMLSDLVDDTAIREAASNLYNRTISAGGSEDAQRALNLESELSSRVIGQGAATKAVAEAMIGIKSGMKDPDAPAGAFLFLGPTGVGKTETVRVTADVMTGDVKNVIRIDMGEFSEPHSIAKLFGSPPGYVGYGDAPRLAELLKNPEAHVLFDEVEKAHPTIWQKLLPLFEEGRVTLGDGKTVSASDATLYMTSNLPPGKVSEFFSPEFLNRLDARIQFNALDKPTVTKILDDVQLPSVLKRAKEAGLDIEVTDAAKSRIVDYGFDPAMGARPLKRSIKNHITTPSGKMILEIKAAGHQIDSSTPVKAVLDIDPAGGGFVMRSADGKIVVPVEGKSALGELAKPITSGGEAAADAATPNWEFTDDAGAAVTPPAPEPAPLPTRGE